MIPGPGGLNPFQTVKKIIQFEIGIAIAIAIKCHSDTKSPTFTGWQTAMGERFSNGER